RLIAACPSRTVRDLLPGLCETPSMKMRIAGLAIAAACAGCGGDGDSATGPSGSGSAMTFFVSSAKSTTGNIGGLRGADSLCQSLAGAAGAGRRTWRAYLSVEHDASNGNNPTDARSRIGRGPWTNASGAIVAR